MHRSSWKAAGALALIVGTAGAASAERYAAAGYGPEFLEVRISAEAQLSLRSGPSTANKVIAWLDDAEQVRNLGCNRAGTIRWCQVEALVGDGAGLVGWVSDRYLVPATYDTSPYYYEQPAYAPPPEKPSYDRSYDDFRRAEREQRYEQYDRYVRDQPYYAAQPAPQPTYVAPPPKPAYVPPPQAYVPPPQPAYAPPPPPQPRTYAAQPKAQDYSVKCSVVSGDCLNAARQTCGGDYHVLGSESYRGGRLDDDQPGPVSWYSMTFRCGPGAGEYPSFAAR